MKKTKDNEQMTMNGAEEAEIFARLSERVEKAVTVIQELRRERDALKARLESAEAKMRDHDEASEKLGSLEEECERYRKERGEVRERVEKMLANLETLDAVGE